METTNKGNAHFFLSSNPTQPSALYNTTAKSKNIITLSHEKNIKISPELWLPKNWQRLPITSY
jgi:hypothetical protein